MERKKDIIVAAVVLIVLIVVIGFFTFFRGENKSKKIDVIKSSDTSHKISVIFINAGKADSHLLLVDDKAYLIDTGESESVVKINDVLMKYGVDKLEGVFLTHSHSDHVGGLKKLSKEYDIEHLYTSNISGDKEKLDKVAEKADLTREQLVAGDRVEIAEGLYIEVLGPLEYNSDDDNDNSIILRLFVNGKVILFTGDMQYAEEKTLLESGTDLKCDILKVGNHGNPDATSEKFARATSPEYAIITTDTNVDEDSANEKVKELFENVYVSMDYSLGIKADIDSDGTISIDEA